MQSKTETKYRKVFLPLSFLISLLVLLYTAWLGDDAFITIRTVDNWVNGFGLTWNINERVQAYTHPLWMLLLSAFHFFIRDGYFTLLIANIVVSLIVFAVFLRHFSAKIFPLFFGWGILILSKAFVATWGKPSYSETVVDTIVLNRYTEKLEGGRNCLRKSSSFRSLPHLGNQLVAFAQ